MEHKKEISEFKLQGTTDVCLLQVIKHNYIQQSLLPQNYDLSIYLSIYVYIEALEYFNKR